MGFIPEKTFVPFDETLTFRSREEKLHEEVYRSIPALNQLANAVLGVTNKISQEARNALLLEDGKSDPALRVLKVQVGMVKRHQMENAQPDIAYLSGAAPVQRQDFESKDNDVWMKP